MPVLKEELQLSTLIDLATDFSKNMFNARNYKGYLDRSSIMKAKKDLVLSFPVLCSDTISPDTAMMVTKAIERECCTTLQLIFAANCLNGETGVEAVKQWHTNMGDLNFAIDKMDLDDYLDISDAISMSIGEDAVVTGFEIKSLCEQFDESLRHSFPVSSFNEDGLDCYSVIPESGRILYEANKNASRAQKLADQQFLYGNFRKSLSSNDKAERDIARGNISSYLSLVKNRREEEKAEREKARHNLDMGLSQAEERRKEAEERRKEAEERRKDKKYNKDMMDSDLQYMKAQLMDSDVRKANELVPSLLIVRYYNTNNVVLDPSGKTKVGALEQQFIIGVKARLIPVPSAEIVTNLVSANKTKVSFLNFIRATTKEISFAKDFVAAIDQAKIDAKKNSKLSKTSPIWRSLQSRAVKSKVNRLLRSVKANDASAITTLVLTDEEANIMKKEFDFDIFTAKNTRFIMDNFNFMGMVVVDEAVEVTHFYLDGNDYWEDYTFSSLEKETGDSSYKKIINLMSKINRV